jgi:ATP-dependent RNA helicase RhlE
MIFDELTPEIRERLTSDGITTPTPIQEKAIPLILQKKDIIGVAQTGTGKTAAFVLPILQLLANSKKQIVPNTPRVLVLAPTRELAVQIDEAFYNYGRLLKIKTRAICGGFSSESQIKSLSKGVDIVVATPGRLMDLAAQSEIDLSQVEYFVLDEAHMMLDLGFLAEITNIYSQLPSNRQSSLFTATTSPKILDLANELLNNPITVAVESEKASDLISQEVYFLYVDTKNALLLELLKNTTKTLIFTRTRYKADTVALFLKKHKISANSIHKNKTQDERTGAIRNFKEGVINVLVATDIAARGIHVDDVSHVINYDIPSSPDVYVHRIGRTARGGKSGTSYSLCSLEERELLRDIEKYTGQEMKVMEHAFHADKVETATAEDIVAKPKKKHGVQGVILHKRIRNSEEYVPPINKKKAKKPRGINKTKGLGRNSGR